MSDLERIQTRLNNIQGIEPILGALRTISLGSWQTALNRRSRVEAFGQRLLMLLPLLAPHLPHGASDRLRQHAGGPFSAENRSTLVVVVGSERGLCGRFNTTVVEAFEDYLTELVPAGSEEPELMALGSRVIRALTKRGHMPTSTGRLSLTKLPPFELAHELTQTWLTRYERYELDIVDLVYNAYHGVGTYKPAVARLFPPEIPPATEAPGIDGWPAPIIQTDPVTLYTRVVQEWAAVTLYGYLLDAATAEHSARYTLMEGATQNTSRLIDELTLALQSARQQAITTEMQELAAGAGLLGTSHAG